MNTKHIGDVTEAMILAALVRKSRTVLVPFGDNARYDLVYEEAGKFVRVQCKTGRVKNGCVRFATASSYAHRGGKRNGYEGEADYFGVYRPQTNDCYLVPLSDTPKA